LNESRFLKLNFIAMIKSIKIISIALLILSIWACQRNKIKSPERLPGKEQLEQFDKLISSIMTDLTIDQYGYAVCSNIETIQLVEQGIQADQAVPVGNISNMFISTLLLQSSEKEEIDIRDNAGNYGIDGEYGKVSLKNLLSFTHNTSGMAINYSPENFRILYKVLEKATNTKVSKLLTTNLGRRLKLKNTNIDEKDNQIQCISSIEDMTRFSMAVDNQKLFEDEYVNNQMFRPVYLETGERCPTGLGCYIDIVDDSKYIWSAGQTGEYATFFLKSAADSLSLIVIAKSPVLNAVFRLENGELLNTPIFYAFKNSLLETDSTAISVKYSGDYSSIRKSIKKMFDSGKRDAVHEELSSYLALYKAAKNQERYDSLAAIYTNFFPNDIQVDELLKEPVAKIDKAMDYMRMQRAFSIPEDTVINILAVGEFTQEMSLNPWEYDNVEMYFDLNHERGTGFNSGADDRQYRFNYDFPAISGNAPTFDSITLVQYDASPNRFNFEIAIPWNILFNNDSIQPKINQLMGFDIAIADNDAEVREGSLAWHSKLNETPWSNTSTYGTMMLSSSAGNKDDTICYAIAALHPVGLDGQNKGEWNGIPSYPIDNEFMEGITGPDDQSGWFRAQWDKKNLYFLVEVQDDVKRLVDKSGDYGWITSAKGDTVWMMREDNSLHAGGSKSNRRVYTTIPLEAGNYILHYQSNQTHSYGRWVNERPELSFYGIVLYK
jgi:hypothetical protein